MLVGSAPWGGYTGYTLSVGAEMQQMWKMSSQRWKGGTEISLSTALGTVNALEKNITGKTKTIPVNL